MNDKYINATKAIKELNDKANELKAFSLRKFGLLLVAECLEKLPAAPAVEPVYCRDCKHFEWDALTKLGHCNGKTKFRTDYCSYGERKDGDSE